MLFHKMFMFEVHLHETDEICINIRILAHMIQVLTAISSTSVNPLSTRGEGGQFRPLSLKNCSHCCWIFFLDPIPICKFIFRSYLWFKTIPRSNRQIFDLHFDPQSWKNTLIFANLANISRFSATSVAVASWLRL